MNVMKVWNTWRTSYYRWFSTPALVSVPIFSFMIVDHNHLSRQQLHCLLHYQYICILCKKEPVSLNQVCSSPHRHNHTLECWEHRHTNYHQSKILELQLGEYIHFVLFLYEKKENLESQVKVFGMLLVITWALVIPFIHYITVPRSGSLTLKSCALSNQSDFWTLGYILNMSSSKKFCYKFGPRWRYHHFCSKLEFWAEICFGELF